MNLEGQKSNMCQNINVSRSTVSPLLKNQKNIERLKSISNSKQNSCVIFGTIYAYIYDAFLYLRHFENTEKY